MTINKVRSGPRAAAAIAAFAATVGALAIGITSGPPAANGQAAQSKGHAMRLIARQDVFQFVDNPPSDDSAGDLVVASDKIYGPSGRRQLGREHITGIETVPGKAIALTGTLVLRHGEIALQGVTNEQNDRPFKLAITGGTGAYRGASGVERVVPVSRTVSHLTLSIRQR